MPKILCNINGIKYRCFMFKENTTFFDVKDKKRFITLDNKLTLKEVSNHLFFRRVKK